MKICRANTYRLYPTDEQAEKMAEFAGVCRFVYNLALEQRSGWDRRYLERTGKPMNRFSQGKELTELRSEFAWIRACPVHAQQQALKDLEDAFKAFFAGRSAYPKYRKKNSNVGFRFSDPSSDFEVERGEGSKGRVWLPKLGWVRFRGWRDMPGRQLNVACFRRAGLWYACSQWESEATAPAPSALPPVGIDAGVKNFAALSDGTFLEGPNPARRAAARLRRAQRKASRKARGSANRRKAYARVARIHRGVACARKDYLHKVTTAIANSHGTVAVEKLNVKGMSSSRNSRLNFAIADQGWYTFRTMLDYKLQARGGRLVAVDPAYTSQTCPACGSVGRLNRRSQARFLCAACGHSAHADTNAAVNILRRAGGPSLPVEGHRLGRPVEAGIPANASPTTFSCPR